MPTHQNGWYLNANTRKNHFTIVFGELMSGSFSHCVIFICIFRLLLRILWHLPYIDPSIFFFLSLFGITSPNSTNFISASISLSHLCTYLNPVTYSFPALSHIPSPNSSTASSSFLAYFCTHIPSFSIFFFRLLSTAFKIIHSCCFIFIMEM